MSHFLEVRDVAEVPEDRTHQRIVLLAEIVLGDGRDQLQRALARFAQERDEVFRERRQDCRRHGIARAREGRFRGRLEWRPWRRDASRDQRDSRFA